MQKFRSDPNGYGIGYPVLGVASVEFSHADPVYIDSDGYLALATSGSLIVGWYTGQGETMAATNATVEKVKPNYVYALGVEMVIGSDQDATQTDIGAYADFGTATTGAFEINLAAGSAAQLFILGFDPEDESDDDAVVCMAAEIQYLAYAQA
ncbi:MAG: hypothetical protein U9O94_01830 [Nanoarchaeota archaeon]|nr:hypothetical protein [Nanoarchaeota archaeon]